MLRRNSEALAAELEALASSVHRHVTFSSNPEPHRVGNSIASMRRVESSMPRLESPTRERETETETDREREKERERLESPTRGPTHALVPPQLRGHQGEGRVGGGDGISGGLSRASQQARDMLRDISPPNVRPSNTNPRNVISSNFHVDVSAIPSTTTPKFVHTSSNGLGSGRAGRAGVRGDEYPWGSPVSPPREGHQV